MANGSEKRFAVLIDAENISGKYIKFILDEISNEGEATYKRIYGDWTKPSLAPWKQVLLEYSVMPVQQYSYTQGKNSSDSAMIIDAMDILYSGHVDGFCLCTSDSDFTRLATRLRESGMTVVGMGEQKTPKAFTSACNKFKYLDLLSSAAKSQSKNAKKQDKAKDAESKSTKPSKKDDRQTRAESSQSEKDLQKAAAEQEKNEKQAEKDAKTGKYRAEDLGIISIREEDEEAPKAEVTSLDEIRSALLSILEEAEEDDDGWVSTGDLGNRLLKRYSDFDVRNYGFTKFTPFLKSLKGFEMKSVRNENSSVKHVYLREYIPDRDKSDD